MNDHVKEFGFDWSLKMVLASDKLSGLRKPVVLAKLRSPSPYNYQDETLIELNSSELDKLLKTLKVAQKVINA